MILFRPVGKAEYGLIAESGFAAYPPRLPEQPIFYPVLKNISHLGKVSNDFSLFGRF